MIHPAKPVGVALGLTYAALWLVWWQQWGRHVEQQAQDVEAFLEELKAAVSGT